MARPDEDDALLEQPLEDVGARADVGARLHLDAASDRLGSAGMREQLTGVVHGGKA